MGWRAFNVAVVISSILWVAVISLWIASTRTPLTWTYGTAGRRQELRLAEHAVAIANDPHELKAELRAYQAEEFAYYTKRAQLLDAERLAHVAFAQAKGAKAADLDAAEAKARASQQAVRDLLPPPNTVRGPERRYVDFVTLLFLCSILPAVWLTQRLRGGYVERMRARLGQCRACGYDVRQTPYRCPECGKPVSRWAE